MKIESPAESERDGEDRRNLSLFLIDKVECPNERNFPLTNFVPLLHLIACFSLYSLFSVRYLYSSGAKVII